ncbi:DUF2306 domain-containing protein [Devosia oryziradicis]|uniref:DUF2306 domain-containing protein n=1 Tax=Devosia oryziradicis TaxID=2801335 RepID=A0ABX7C0D5_9HYPH|nr:DUF2306 domain-containing protein [Devosia oryziradicis]QQR37243.1 DUF2306 domain-containing protein [Devosia oryziradicis]
MFVIYVALRGISESFDNDGFPEPLAVKLELLPVIFPVHMVSGGLALLLVPLVLYMRGTRWHRLVGRVTAAIVLVAGLTAIPVAVVMPVTEISAAGFVAQGVAWIVLLALGIWHIRRGQVAPHRACMLMMAAVTSGALFFRIYLGLWKAVGGSRHFEAFYALDAWIAWGLPLVAMAIWLRLSGPRHLGQA